MAADTDFTRFQFGNLTNTLSSSEYEKYLLLNREFQSAFGTNFGNFDYYRYLTDANYASIIDKTAIEGGFDVQGMGNKARKGNALQALTNFFSGLEGGPDDFTKVDAGPTFAQARSEVGALAEQSKRQRLGDINRGFAGAQDRVSESLAGTGLGRSGIAAGEFANIETQRLNQTTSSIEAIESARLATEQSLVFQEMNFELTQELAEQGWDQGLIESALAMQRQFQMMNFQALQNYEPSSWMDDFGGFIDLGLSAVELYSGVKGLRGGSPKT